MEQLIDGINAIFITFNRYTSINGLIFDLKIVADTFQ